MEAKFSEQLKNIISFSREEAIRLGNDSIGIEHFLLGILREGMSSVMKILQYYSIDAKELKQKVEKSVYTGNKIKDTDNLPFLKQAEKCLKRTYLEAKIYHTDAIEPEHLLLAILRDEDNLITKLFEQYGVDYQMVTDEIKTILKSNVFHKGDTQVRSELPHEEPEFGETGDDRPIGSRPIKPADGRSKTPVLDNFGRDLTRLAEENKLDPVVGRERELERIAQILSRRKKNNPILIGEPGVGKSAIAEGLALRIIQRKVSRALFDKRIVALDVASLVAGTKYRGQFEERMKALINELEKNPDVIIFIDEIHTMVGAGGATGSLDASNMFKPALARGEIQCIGATTLDEYRQNIEKDGALERRFQKIIVEATSPEETYVILNNIKGRYEDHHLVTYTDEAIKACVNLTQRYVSDRFLPDKAIDALDEAGSRVHITHINVPEKIVELESQIEAARKNKQDAIKATRYEKAAEFRDMERQLSDQLSYERKKWEDQSRINREVVDAENVAEVVAMITGVPVQRIAQNEGSRLINMETELRGSIIGQDEAVLKVVKAIRRNRAGLKDPNKPIGSFIFLGPTGVGKTLLAKVLSRYLFDSDDALIRVDMSEYMEKFAISRLVGAPPGYVGYEEGGQLSEKVRRKPYSVVLLDEIEKAHPDVFHLLLQVLDDGLLTDSYGRKIDFKNTIIIMTSNIGSRQLKEFGTGVGFNTSARKESIQSDTRNVIEKALKKAFAPEFLNRIDDIVMFDALEREDIHKIIEIELKSLYKRIENLGYSIDLTETAKDFLVEKGWDPQFGARPLKRAIQRYIEDELAEEIIKADLMEGDKINIDFNTTTNSIEIKIIKGQSETKSVENTD
ncbi:MAG: ATP-dependent Clp protease ATP-binding subunit [Bacteroidales bacterium]|nr:ATP-dependent Clp protease ATP-binding subunit [Bacteroidales bacterium]